MKKSRNGFMKNLRYLCLIGVVALGLMTIGTGCGGGGGDGAPAPPSETTPPTTPTTYNTGNQDFTVEDGEEADPLGGHRVDDPESTLLPSSVDHSSQIPDVKSQGSTSSCTSWATGYYLKTYQEVVEEGWDKNQNALSPMYLYAMQCRKYYQQPWHLIRAWEVLNQDGIAKLSTMPFVDLSGAPEIDTYADVPISESIHLEAREYRGGEMSRLYNLNQVKNGLTSGPVLLGINNYSFLSPGEGASPENNYMVYDPTNSNAGHAVLCVGYDDSKFGVGALKFVNSWGPTWGENGYSWIKYSDSSNIVTFAMTIKDRTNSSTADVTDVPDAPTGVIASDSVGPYVDISWSKVSAAQYYMIYKAKTDDATTYKAIAIAYDNEYRDNPQPEVSYYYSVVAVNDRGESDHKATDTDEKGYVDIGKALGAVMTTPSLAWTFNNSDYSSNFEVSNIDSTATTMQVTVSTASEGPWDSLGWIAPGGFTITWGDDSEYVGKKPFVKVSVEKADGYSEFSEAAQVGTAIGSSTNVASIQTLTTEADNDSITLSWTTDSDNVDFFELWRYKAALDEANDWVPLGYALSTDDSYDDTTALVAISYYYAVFAVYQGAYSEAKITDSSTAIPITEPNLYLYGFTYNYGQITGNPVHFDLTVVNDGATAIDDYEIVIWAYDWFDGMTYQVSTVFNASDVAAAGLLPLPSGYYHILSFNLNIPSAFANAHYYSWGVGIDPNNTIAEYYETDNLLWGYSAWWAYYGSLSLISKLGVTMKGASPNSQFGSTRPFSKKYNKAAKSMRSTLSKDKAIVGPINYKKPSFSNNHAE